MFISTKLLQFKHHIMNPISHVKSTYRQQGDQSLGALNTLVLFGGRHPGPWPIPVIPPPQHPVRVIPLIYFN